MSSDDTRRKDPEQPREQGPDGGEPWEERNRSRYENSYTYTEARRESKVPIVIGILSVAVVVLAAVVMLGGDLHAFVHLPTAQDSDGNEVQVSQAAAGGSEAPTNVTIDITMAGDVYLRYSAFQSGQTDGGYDYSHLFENVSDELQGADLVMLNQEGSLAGEDFGYVATQAQVNSPQELGEAEVAAGFDYIVRANDHALDEGADGLHSELEFWGDQDGVTVLGASDPQGTSTDPDTTYVYEKSGFKVAILSYTADPATTSDDEHVSAFDESTVASDVEAAKDDGADMVVACMHWGQPYSSAVSATQRRQAQALADAGVDVIFGTHPHVLQPVETLSGDDDHSTLCFWSLGSLINSGMSETGYVGGIAKVELQKGSDGTCSVASSSLVPTVIHEGTTSDTMSVYPASEYTTSLADTNAYSDVTPTYVDDLLESLYGDDYDSSSKVVTF